MTGKTAKKSIVITDKYPLPESNSVAAEGVGADKSEVTGRKIRVTKAAAIMTTPPITIDMATIKDAVEICAGLVTIAGAAKSIIKNKKDHPSIEETQVSGDGSDPYANTKISKQIDDKHRKRKKYKKSCGH